MPASGAAGNCKLVCLTGFMGSGKTTVGQLLARQLAWRFVDLDTRIEQRAGLTITQIFERQGEPLFRQIEHEELRRALGEATDQPARTVIALGGGTWAQPPNTELLRRSSAVVVWLDCPMDVLLARCVTMTHRPLFRDEASFRKLYAERLPFYQQADYRVESSTDPRRVVEQILALGFLRVAALRDGPAAPSAQVSE